MKKSRLGTIVAAVIVVACPRARAHTHVEAPTTEACFDELRRAPLDAGLRGAKLTRSPTAQSGESAFTIEVQLKRGRYAAWLRPRAVPDEEDWSDLTAEVNLRDRSSWDSVQGRRHGGWEAAIATKNATGGEGSVASALDTTLLTALENCLLPSWSVWAKACIGRLDEARVRAARLDPSLRRVSLGQYGYVVELDVMNKRDEAWIMATVGARPAPSERSQEGQHMPVADRWLPTIYDGVSVLPSALLASARFEEAIFEYASGRSARAMQLFSEASALEKQADACFKGAPSERAKPCGFDSDRVRPIAPTPGGAPGGLPPIEELIFETPRNELELLGPVRPNDGKQKVILRFGYARTLRDGRAKITIMDGTRAAVRTVMKELQPALDACLVDVPEPRRTESRVP